MYWFGSCEFLREMCFIRTDQIWLIVKIPSCKKKSTLSGTLLLPFSALIKTFSFSSLTSPCHCLSLCSHLCLLLSLSFFRWPFKGYPPTHRRRPLLRLHQRQLHRCKWKRIECYYWLPTKPTKPHSLARMSGLYTFIASSRHPSCHFTHPATLKTHHTYRTCVFLRCQCLAVFLLSLSTYSWMHPFRICHSILMQPC